MPNDRILVVARDAHSLARLATEDTVDCEAMDGSPDKGAAGAAPVHQFSISKDGIARFQLDALDLRKQ